MDLSQQFRAAFSQLRSVDFWLFAASFMISGFTLQALPSIAAQTGVLAAILVTGMIISYSIKRRSGWTRRQTGWKGVLSACGVFLFIGYAICTFSIYVAGLRKLELSGSFFAQAHSALSDPVVFGGVMPFMFLGVYSGASYLGLSDLPNSESAS